MTRARAALSATGLIVVVALVVGAAPLGTNPRAVRAATPDTWDDFNGDGYHDLAIGVPQEDLPGAPDAGVVHVLYGGPTGVSATGDQLWSQDDWGTGGAGGIAESGDRFGTSLAAGDFNDDGFGDLAIGAPGENANRFQDIGLVNVLFGSDQGLTATGAVVILESSGEGYRSGQALAALDFLDNESGDIRGSDGIADLAVGRPGAPGGGLVTIRSGHQAIFPGPSVTSFGCVLGSQHECGSALAAGDLDDDPTDEIVVGAPSSTVGGVQDAGIVTVWSDTAFLPELHRVFHQDSRSQYGTNDQFDEFGWSVAVGDTNGDGFEDIHVGIPGESNDGVGSSTPQIGRVLRILGSADGPTNTANSIGIFQQSVPGTAAAGDLFGWSVAVANLGNGQTLDLAVGAPGRDVSGLNGAGAAYVIYFGIETEVWTQASAGVAGSPAVHDRLGYSVWAGDLGKTGTADLAIGVPRDEPDNVTDAGSVHVLYGTSNGLTAADDQLWQQDSTGILGTAETNDRFGESLGP